jgi:ParB family transcriptional regulator, chromosome partitioning protein
MVTKKTREVQWGKAKETGERASKSDELKDDVRSKSFGARDARRLPNTIKPRTHGNTRDLDLLHVIDLAESIEALGLLQPIAIDKDDFLVAGEHRLVACQLLSMENNARSDYWDEVNHCSKKPFKSENKKEDAKLRVMALNHEDFKAKYKGFEIPVVVLPFDSQVDKEQALLAETAENEKRQNYTKDEILNLAEKLRESGYIERAGRPKEGEKSLKTALSVISGKSWRQICRDMKSEKTMTRVIVSEKNRELEKISKMLLRYSDKYPDDQLAGLFINMNKKVIKHLDAVESVTSDKQD